MSTQLHSMRQTGLLAGIGLAVTVVVVALWQPQLQAVPPAASDLAVHPGAAAGDQMLIANQLAGTLPFTTEQLYDQNSTAVLFLIDESGGVSGRCDGIKETEVFSTDRDMRRYELVRFYLQLWRAYYQFLQDEDALESVSRPVDLGVMQFARDVPSPVFQEIRPIEELLGAQGIDRFGKLRSQDGMSPAVDANWFCGTDFNSALDRAAEELTRSEAERKVLVLLTDGSTRGNESEFENENKRSATRQSIENALRRLKNSEIEVLTVLWRRNECVEENTCGLSSPNGEFEQRRDDLARWESWERASLLTLIDDEHAIKALAETPSFSPLLPGVGQYATGWIDGTTNQTIRSFFSEVARLLKVVVITSDDISPGEIRFRPRSISGPNPTSYSELVFQNLEPQWYSAEKDITGSSTTCPQRALDIRINEPVLAYYWLPFEQDWPKIKSVSVEPQEVIIDRLSAGAIPSEERTIDVKMLLEPIDMNHHNCFVAQVLVAGEVYSDTLPRDDSTILFSDIILPDDIAHGLTAITAQLAFKNAPEVAAGVEKSSKFGVAFQPIFPETIDFTNVNAAESVTVTVPVTFAAQVPGFEPKFGLFPNKFDPDIGFPPPATTPGPNRSLEEENCPSTQPLDSVLDSNSLTITSDPASQFVTNYAAAFPKRAIERCGYKYLLVKWTSSDTNGHKWIDLVDTGANSHEPTSIPVTPSPTPTPPIGGGGGNGHRLPVWAVVLIGLAVLVVIGIFTALWLKKRK